MVGPEHEKPPPPEDDPLFGEPETEADDPGGERAGRYGFVPDFVRKLAVAGLGAVFMTEEGLRALAGQLKLPKEALGFVLSQAERTKDEVGRVLSDELRRFLQSDKLRDEFLKLIAGMTIEVKAEVRLVPDKNKAGEVDDGTRPLLPKIVVNELNTRRAGHKKKE